MSRRNIGQEKFGFAISRSRSSSLDELLTLIDWMPIDDALKGISCAAKGEPAWPPLALFKGMLLSIWYDLSDVRVGLEKASTISISCEASGEHADVGNGYPRFC